MRPAIPGAIATGRLIAIARGVDPDRLVRIGTALAATGIRAFEVTLNSDGAVEAIRRLRAHFSEEELVIGAGTVLSIEQAQGALNAGAAFLVMPDVDVALVRWAADRGVPCFPGGLTPTEIHAAWRAGAAGVKVFPASAVGPAFVRDFRGPFRDIPLIPTGGVTLDDAADYLRAGAFAVGLGGGLIGDGEPGALLARAQRLVASIRDVAS